MVEPTDTGFTLNNAEYALRAPAHDEKSRSPLLQSDIKLDDVKRLT